MNLHAHPSTIIMRATTTTWALLLLVVVLGLSDEAQAANEPVDDTTWACSHVGVSLVGGQERHFFIYDSGQGNDPSAGQFECSTNPTLFRAVVETSRTFGFRCAETTIGAAPPVDTTSLVVKFFSDNDQFGNVNGAAIRSYELFACPVAPDPPTGPFQFFCTSDGTATGAPRYGLVRMQVRATNNPGVALYDVNSETQSVTTVLPEVGVVNCMPHADTLTDHLGTGASPTVYQGGDSFRSKFNISQGAAYKAGNVAKLDLVCVKAFESYTVTIPISAGFTPAVALTDFDLTLSQSNDSLRDRCWMHQKVTLHTTSTIGVYAGLPYAVWNQENPLPGATFNAGQIPGATELTRNTTKQRTIFYPGFAMRNLDDKVTPPTSNLTLFTIGVDVQTYRVLDMQNARLEIVSGVTGNCAKTNPSFSVVSTQSIGTSDSLGKFDIKDQDVVAPAGEWSLNCTLTLTPNIGFYNFSFNYTSPFTGNLAKTLLWNVTSFNATHLNFNVTFQFTQYVAQSDQLLCAYPSEAPRLSIWGRHAHNGRVEWDDQWANMTLTILSGERDSGLHGCAFYANVAIPRANASQGLFGYVIFNFTGSGQIGSGSYQPSTERFTLASVDIVTALDPYIPFLLWLGLFIFFIWTDAFFPSVVTFLIMAESVLPTSLFIDAASFMFIMLSLVIHAMVIKWPDVWANMWTWKER